MFCGALKSGLCGALKSVDEAEIRLGEKTNLDSPDTVPS